MSDKISGPCPICGFLHEARHCPKKAQSSFAAPAGSTTWPIVLEFAKRMEAKLEKNRHKGDREAWLNEDPDDLLERLREEVCELDNAMVAQVKATKFTRTWNAEQIANEAADVANFAMFIADLYMERAKSGNAQAQARPE